MRAAHESLRPQEQEIGLSVKHSLDVCYGDVNYTSPIKNYQELTFFRESGAVRNTDGIWGFCWGVSSSTPQNCTIGVNFGIFWTTIIHMPPLQGLGFLGQTLL